MAELDKLQRSSTRTKDLSSVREELARRITTVHQTETARLERLRDQLNEVNRVWEEGAFDTTELTVAIEEELDELRERRDTDIELAQIGLALNTVSHEFEKNVGSIREGIQRLGAWAAENPELNDLHHDLRVSFDHLDEYLTLFTQLDRRANATRIEITGKQIFEFCERLFSARLQRHRIEFVGSTLFRRATLESYPSSIYPVFVNLIDNAIYWLQRNRGDRKIILDADGTDLLIRDNGPGISIRDRENIFALNFSRKPGGRGMGLHISRETLARVGLKLDIDPRVEGEGATFRISHSADARTKPGRKRR
jgi:signal transduction histidine kinase